MHEKTTLFQQHGNSFDYRMVGGRVCGIPCTLDCLKPITFKGRGPHSLALIFL